MFFPGRWCAELREVVLACRPHEGHGYGFVTYFRVPGDFTVPFYEPKCKK
jgi:hypothetical protein